MQNKQLTIEKKPIKNCAFTGHRLLEESFSYEKLQKIVLLLSKEGVENFFLRNGEGI